MIYALFALASCHALSQKILCTKLIQLTITPIIFSINNIIIGIDQLLNSAVLNKSHPFNVRQRKAATVII